MVVRKLAQVRFLGMHVWQVLHKNHIRQIKWIRTSDLMFIGSEHCRLSYHPLRKRLLQNLVLVLANVKTTDYVYRQLTTSIVSGIDVVKRSADQCSCDDSLPCAGKYQRIPDHTACLSRGSTAVPGVLTQAEKDAIVAHHNRLRGVVDPVATNMLKMLWDDEVAMLAQKWAEACDTSSGGLHHDIARNIPGRYSVGQNIGTGYKNFSDAIEAWFAEKDNYKPMFGTSVRSVGGSKPIGHYTQLVWATTNRVGCGFAHCSGLAFHVCNYAPIKHFNLFFNLYGKPRRALWSDCGDLTCENYGKLDVSTCSCDCKYKEYHVGPKCQMNCTYDKDLYFCGTQGSFYQSDCGIPYTSSACPKMCEVPMLLSAGIPARDLRARRLGRIQILEPRQPGMVKLLY
ncbi:hypothetical protein EGW08_001656 [Elysia chlorotica]|uniref:SCP domain-containing protein n=1 Tax=Elysia chlorotica TaxID=188477 RepID=A0A3S1BSY5_ELYCH|nr:hypothetical protein EGW08_001656 [Elysia chlorotica]